jgi:hypothetical protein
MHRIVPVVGLSGHLALQAIAGGGSAISPEANAVHKAVTEVVELTERSLVLFGKKASALSQLAELAAECAQQGWDGDTAAGINPNAVLYAEHFVRALPEGIPLPEFTPEPDGSISLDWIRSPNRSNHSPTSAGGHQRHRGAGTCWPPGCLISLQTSRISQDF